MIVIGNTLTTYAMLDPDRAFLWESWLLHAEKIKETHEIQYFCAIQIDGRGKEPFKPLTDRLDEIEGKYWFYTLEDGRTRVTGENRGRHLCAGLNMVGDFATANHATHWLRLESDCEAPVDVIPKLLEVDNGLAAAACSTYFNYDHPAIWALHNRNGVNVAQGPMTAVCLLTSRELFKRLKWRWDPDLSMTDDPSYSKDAKDLFGVDTVTRLDCVALHHPAAIGPIDTRYPGLDMEVT